MWVGWLNLENLYGSEDTLGKVFESALQQNEPIEVYRRLVTVYVQSSKHELATKLYQTMTKKFAGTQWVWSQYATFLMKQGRQTQARGLLQRALKALSSKQDRMFCLCLTFLIRPLCDGLSSICRCVSDL